MNTTDKFSTQIKIQAKSQNISHAYLIFGDLNPATFIDTYKIKTPDVFLIDENPIKINHVRELIHWLYLKPHSSTLKLAVLRNVDNMTIEAANSLLKVLEEPPEYAVLVLQASKKEKILPTILSRCQMIRQDTVIETEVPQNYLAGEKISLMSLKERFDYAAKIAEDENLQKIINRWEGELRLELLSGRDVRQVLKQIILTRSLLLTNTSVKLLLENLFLKF